MNTIVDAVNEFYEIKDLISANSEFVASQQKFTSKPFLAKIVSNHSVGTIEFTRWDGSSEEITVVWAYKWIAVSAEEQGDMPSFDIKGGDDAALQITTQKIADSWQNAGDWTYTGYAFNLAELANKITYASGGVVNGVKITSEAYPTTFKPVGIASENYVMLTKNSKPSGLPYFVFDRLGTHDGDSCP